MAELTLVLFGSCRLPRIKFTEEKKRRVTEEEEGKKGKKASRA